MLELSWLGVAEVGVHSVRHDVGCTAGGLVGGQGIGGLGVHDGEGRAQAVPTNAPLGERLVVGNNREDRSLRASCSDGGNGTHGEVLCKLGALKELPHIAFEESTCRNSLCGVDRRASAQANNDANLVLLGELDSLTNEREARVGYDACKLNNLEASSRKGSCCLLEVRLFPGTVARVDHHCNARIAGGSCLLTKTLDSVAAKDEPGLVLIFKIDHGFSFFPTSSR